MIELQNIQENIGRLRAQKALYSSAKAWGGFQLVLTVFVVMLISISVLMINKGWFVSYFGLSKGDYSWVLSAYGFVIIFFDALVITPVIDRRKVTAARIQQSFDSNVLGLSWNKLFYGVEPNYELIIEWSKKFKGDEVKLLNWYAIRTRELPIDIRRIVCQKTNCWWDANIRGRYNKYLYCLGSMMIVVLLTSSLIMDLSMQGIFLNVLAPIAPFCLFAIKTINLNKQAVSRLEKIIADVDTQWASIASQSYSDECLRGLSNSIQYCIFLNRKESPLIFDFFYNRSRDDNDDTMNRSADEYVSEYLAVTVESVT